MRLNGLSIHAGQHTGQLMKAMFICVASFKNQVNSSALGKTKNYRNIEILKEIQKKGTKGYKRSES